MSLLVFTNGGVTINGSNMLAVTQASVDPRIALFENRGSGHVDINFMAQNTQAPVASFTTNAIKTFLDLVGISGLAIGTVAELWNFKLAENGTRSATTDHEKWTINHGLVVPRRLSVRQGGEATITADILAAYDGSNAPIIRGTGAIPANIQDQATKFTLAKINWGGLGVGTGTLYETQGLDIDFGIREMATSASGKPYVEHYAIAERTIRATVTTHDLTIRGVVTPAGALDTFIAFLTKIDEAGTRVADATAEHIALTMTEAMAQLGNGSASQNQMATQEVIFTANYDGTNAPMTIATTSAIAAAA